MSGMPHVRLGKIRSLLKERMAEGKIIRIMETHNGLTGILAETTTATRPDGSTVEFDGMWSSSLTASATKGKPDIEQVDTSSRIGLVKDTLDVTSKPMIYDADTGGQPEIFRYTVRELEALGVSACIIEDKTGLKQNSLFGTERKQVLADVGEFSHKIACGVKAKRTDSFMVIARLESLIAGYGVDDAIMRAQAYIEAGADGIMIHSKDKDTSQVFEFLERYSKFEVKRPVVAVPTSYNHVTEEELAARGVNICIYANHMLRAAYPSMKSVAENILKCSRSLESDKVLLPVKQVITLIDSNPLNPDAKPAKGGTAAPTETIAETGPLDVEKFFQVVQGTGVDFFCGVPDSLLAPFCQYVTDNVSPEKHIITANEGASIGTAAGYYMASGKIPMVYLQNSGVGNLVNPVLSLAHKEVYGIPMILFIGWRGAPGTKDEPQHVVMGKQMTTILNGMDIQSFTLPMNQDAASSTFEAAVAAAKKDNQPVAVLVPPKLFKGDKNVSAVPETGMTRERCIKAVLSNLGEKDAVVSTTGYTSREVYESRQALNQSGDSDFLCVGSMGHALAIAQGVALAQPDRRVVCLDGDGATLMHMGTMALSKTVNAKNLVHIILRNNKHDSVGGQPIGNVDHMKFDGIAQSVGYTTSKLVSNEEDLIKAVQECGSEGPYFIEAEYVFQH